jgi:hypothetical protein
MSPVMTNADTNLREEGDLVPPVDPEDIKRLREFEKTSKMIGANGWQWLQDRNAAFPSADIGAISDRDLMIKTLAIYKLLSPWQHGEELDDAVFRIAATFPLREHKHRTYMIPGDETLGFDPNAFVQRLIEETGISHVSEPVVTRIPEGGRMIVTVSANFEGQAPNPERNAKHQARQILWGIWKRFAPSLDEVVSHSEKEQAAEVVATIFADFLLDNIDLVRQLEDSFKDLQHVPLDPILSELEQRAQRPG